MGPPGPLPTMRITKTKINGPAKKEKKWNVAIRLPMVMVMVMPMGAAIVYKLYRALTYGVSPLVYLHLRWRKIRGREHPLRWPERLGRPSVSRPPGPLIWFHAVSLGEGMAAIPVIKHCRRLRPDLHILMTTTTYSAFEVIKNRLPSGVIYQIALGLLNARVSTKSFKQWSGPLFRPLISLLLSKFSLIAPLSTLQAIRFQLLEASPFTINFSGDLKYVHEYDESEGDIGSIEDLKASLAHRQVWMASSIHRGEEKVMLAVHKVLMQKNPNLVTIIVPRHPQHGKEIAQKLQKEGEVVALRSRHEKLMPRTNVYVVDTLGELRQLYKLTPIAVIGGSFLPGLAGHNISEAAAAGCAVLTGPHIGHYSNMVSAMQRLNPKSVLQVSGKSELEEAVSQLFSDARVLEAQQMAAKQAFCALSSGIVANVWNLLNFHVFRRALC
ncbi:probable 3-deoxy-D-manno-octulosonic acid transferase, mitochondrial isoform X4 [Citrus sinensis]|uniref:probable 3-deoxy-D-manno-octulosonic acid transferase, mitochondrial isoform X4 n=1 Tax=Citrus sinensis TaxID=2711 RepID=UPI000D62F096|nr:probable 3-deoxy-D-manno-octulosonic acid transferase, mitochondrial isoform X4 [Citrus sinensis]